MYTGSSQFRQIKKQTNMFILRKHQADQGCQVRPSYQK